MTRELTPDERKLWEFTKAYLDENPPERGSQMHWRTLGNQPARVADNLREALLASTACGTAQAVCESASWRKLNEKGAA